MWTAHHPLPPFAFCQLGSSEASFLLLKLVWRSILVMDEECKKGDEGQIAITLQAASGDPVVEKPNPDQSQDSSDIASQEPEQSNTKLSRRAIKRLRREELRKHGKASSKKGCKVSEEKANLIHQESLAETSHYLDNGLRKVYPYFYTFTTYAKQRWVGQKILDVFVKEFKSEEPEAHRETIGAGNVKVNSKVVTEDYILKDNDFITNVTHRHELPVTGAPIEVLVETPGVVVVNKPSSIPIHPCGRYRHNSLVYIMAKELNKHNLRPAYRLDRMTSGLMIISKTDQQAKLMHEQVRKRQVQKEYVCKVQGEFPSGEVECQEPLDFLSHALGLIRVTPGGKESRTTFTCLSTDGSTSVVKCEPHTGRTHQIRVHLQYLGFPIVNDTLYNHPVWGPDVGKGGNFCKSDEQLIQDLIGLHSDKAHLDTEGATTASVATDIAVCSEEKAIVDTHKTEELIDTEPPAKKPKTENGEVDSNKNHSEGSTQCASQTGLITNIASGLPPFDPAKMTYDPKCTTCQKTYKDPTADELVMYLHAYRYKGPDWEYSTPLPDWATEDS